MDEMFTGKLHVLQQLNKYEFAFEADILRDGPVQGGRWDFRNLDQYYKTFKGQPVLVAYTHNGRQVGDGHNAQELRDPKTGEPYRSFTAPTAERIVGMISEDDEDITIVEMDGHKWLRVRPLRSKAQTAPFARARAAIGSACPRPCWLHR